MPANGEIVRRIEEFQGDLIAMQSDGIARKYIYTVSPYIVTEALHSELREEVSSGFGIHTNDVHMVGSGKMGFSIKPGNEYRYFNEETSDIDIAIVSKILYEEIWQEVHTYRTEVGFWRKYEDFKKYHFYGWIRPDVLPPGASFDKAEYWWSFFRELTSEGKYGSYAIRAGLYHSAYHLESYLCICINNCMRLVGGRQGI